MKARGQWFGPVLLALVLIVGAGNLIATFALHQEATNHRSEEVCSTLGRLITEPNSPSTARLINGWGSIYGCDWSHP